MPLRSTAARVAAVVVTAVTLLGAGAAGLLWHAAGASANGPHAAAAVTAVAVTEPSTTSTTVPPPSTTTSTSIASTSTSTTKPKPPPTTAPVRVTVPRTAPVPTAPATTAPRPAPTASASAEERCAAALTWVGQHGLALPGGWGFRCPGQAVENGSARWGVACWNCEGNGSWIAVDVARIGSSDATLHYVIAHEICHAIDYMGMGTSTEAGADLCAALHGAPRQ